MGGRGEGLKKRSWVRPSPVRGLTPASTLSRTAGEGLPELCENCLDYTLGVREDVVIPKAEHAPAFGAEPGGSPSVVTILCVLAAVGFDDQAMLGAGEIGDERADWVLPAEAVSDEAAIPQCRP